MRKVTIIGAGPGNPDLLSRAALDAIDIADVVIGAHRALAGIDVPPDVVRCELVKTADIVAALTDAASWQRAVVVMTGDVGLFSGARRLVEALSGDAQVDVRVIPGISSASYLAARLARPWQDWRFASAHGVACDIVAEAERAGELFLVTSGGEDPSRLSGELVQAGFGDARVTVAERLSYPDERITCATASEIAGQTFDDLNVMLIEFAGGAGSPAGSSAASEAPAGASAPAATSSVVDSAGASRAASSRWPYASSGIPDELFIRGDVPMTKQEVRAVALAKLRLTATDTVWDVGAGTGSVSIEAALVARAGSVWAVERNAAGVRLIRENADAFGCGNVHAVPGVAPEALAKLPVPDAVFVGGSAGELPSIVEAALEKNPQVRLMRGGKLYGISAERLLKNPKLDTTLRGGDKVYLEDDERYFLTLGATKTEAQIPFPQEKVSALDAASLAGGLNDARANPKGVLVLRDYDSKHVRSDGSGPSKDRMIFAIDLTTADGLFSAGEFMIEDRDLVMVTESSVMNSNSTIKLIYDLMGVGTRARSLSR